MITGGKVFDEEDHARRLVIDRDQHSLMHQETSLGSSATWNTVVRPDLWAYGCNVLPKKIRTGQIFRMIAEVNVPLATLAPLLR